MADLPIPFTAPMVRALHASTKTQTRRLPKHQPEQMDNGKWHLRGIGGGCFVNCEEDIAEAMLDYLQYAVGDRLYVREAWRSWRWNDGLKPSLMPFSWAEDRPAYLEYDADGPGRMDGRSRRGMHLPRIFSRTTLIVTTAKFQRLQDISEEDARAEGTQEPSLREFHASLSQAAWSERQVYGRLWEAINGAGSWDANPWVAAYTFTVHHQNIDQMEAA